MAAENDREEIPRLHSPLVGSKFNFDIPKMRSVFAGERHLQFNLNGHPYYGLAEKTKLWEALKGNLSIPEISEPMNLRLKTSADMDSRYFISNERSKA